MRELHGYHGEHRRHAHGATAAADAPGRHTRDRSSSDLTSHNWSTIGDESRTLTGVSDFLRSSSEVAVSATAGLAGQAAVDKSVASRTVAQLVGLGLVERSGYQGALRVVSLAELAELLAARTAWPGTEVVTGYAWGRTILDTAATISRSAADAGIDIAVTGRAGAAFLGVLGTSSPSEVRCWASVNGRSLEEVAADLGLEPAPAESANVRLSADRWRFGVHRRTIARFDELTAMVAHPLRVWCDLHGEQRGSEFAAQLWGEISNA